MTETKPMQYRVSVKATYSIPGKPGSSDRSESTRIFDETNTTPELLGLPEGTEATKVGYQAHVA